MKSRLILLIASFLVAGLVLSACGPSAPEPTPTPGSGGGGAPADSGSSGGTAAGADASTGLTLPPVAAMPSGASAPAPATNIAHGTAVLAISGDLPIVFTGGDCDYVGDDFFLTIYPDSASLIISPGSGSTRTGTMVWKTSGLPQDNAAVSAEDPMTITLNDDGFSGSFEGRAFRVGGPGEPVAVHIGVSGTFTCISHLLRVGGEHPVDLTGVACSSSPSFSLRAGTPGENAALLVAADGATAGSTVEGGLSWRVGGVSYTTTWLSIRINSDGVSGSYFGEATAPGGSPFSVSGSFNCLGG